MPILRTLIAAGLGTAVAFAVFKLQNIENTFTLLGTVNVFLAGLFALLIMPIVRRAF